MNLQESIALVYDPLKTAQGMLAFRAFRITQRYLDQIKYDPETQECPDPALEDIRRNKIMSKVKNQNSVFSSKNLETIICCKTSKPAF